MVVDKASIRSEDYFEFSAFLQNADFEPVIVTKDFDLEGLSINPLKSICLINVDTMSDSELRRCISRCAELKLKSILMVPPQHLSILHGDLIFDDFILTPISPEEIVARTKMIFAKAFADEAEDIVRAGDLLINTANYEVTVLGRRINLRLKEYELLLLLVSNPGRVYTRDALLSHIWGYEYLGGTRTVDVHVRRLRSKIEDPKHTFIETVWNVGYRFHDLSTVEDDKHTGS